MANQFILFDQEFEFAFYQIRLESSNVFVI
jgi:hypothetical protein